MNTPGTHPTATKSRPAPKTRSATKADWLVPAGLIALSAIPLLGGAGRLASMASSKNLMPDDVRVVVAPLPLVIHIITALLFCILGALQFSNGFRRRRPGWHRRVGRVLVLCGLVAGLSALWMTLLYPFYPNIQGALLYGFRLVFGSAMVVSIGLSMAAILRRDIAGHRAWMLRGYAIGQGAGTQALISLAWMLSVGPLTPLSRELLMGAGWAINLALAEWLIRRRSSARRSIPAAARQASTS